MAFLSGAIVQFVFKLFSFDIKRIMHRTIEDELLFLKKYIKA